jgi:hypothetical protein
VVESEDEVVFEMENLRWRISRSEMGEIVTVVDCFEDLMVNGRAFSNRYKNE